MPCNDVPERCLKFGGINGLREPQAQTDVPHSTFRMKLFQHPKPLLGT
jgi:hypothetical protein